jgi:O-antigen/teichoic acid export membrane protein
MATVIGQFMRNMVTSWASMIITLAITFFFTPYLIDMLGKERYGIWSLAFSIVAYLGLADLGMKQSVVRYISKYYALNDWKQLNQVYSTSMKIYFYIALIILAASAAIVFGLLPYFKISPEYLRITQIAFLILGIDQAVTYAMLPMVSLGAFHRFDITTVFHVAGRIAQTIGIIVILEMGYGLIAMAIVVAIASTLDKLGVNLIRRIKYPEVRFSITDIDKEKMSMLLKYGLYSFLIVGTWIIIFQSDSIIIGRFVSMEAVAIYAVAAAIITQLRGALNIISVPLVPAVSHMEAGQDFGRIMSFYNKAARYLYYVSGYACFAVLLFGGPFIILWVGEDFRPAIKILQVLIIAGAICFPQSIANSVLFGISRHKIAFYILLAEAMTKIILSLILLKYYGIFGVALGTAIPQVIIYSFIYPSVFYRVMNSNPADFYRVAIRSVILSAVFVLPGAFLMLEIAFPDSWHKLILDGIVITITMLAGMYLFILDDSDRGRMKQKLRKFIMRDKSVYKTDAAEEIR